MRKSTTILVLAALLCLAAPATAVRDRPAQPPTISGFERVLELAATWWEALLDKARADVTGNGASEPSPDPDPEPEPPPETGDDEARADVTGNG